MSDKPDCQPCVTLGILRCGCCCPRHAIEAESKHPHISTVVGERFERGEAPFKMTPARSVTDYFWVIAPPEVVRVDELPVGVGLYVVTPSGLRPARHANRNLDRVLQGHDRALIAAALRRIDPLEPRGYWEAQARAAEAKGYAKGLSAGKHQAGAKRRKFAAWDDGEPLRLP